MEEERREKMIAISAASEAIRFREKNPRSTESEVIQHVTDKVDSILKNIDNPL